MSELHFDNNYEFALAPEQPMMSQQLHIKGELLVHTSLKVKERS